MKILFDYSDPVFAYNAADDLRRVAGMIEDGFTSGELVNGNDGSGCGWWSTEGEFEGDD